MTMTTPRVVLVTRISEYEALLERHATRAQAEFFLRTRGQSIDAVQAVHQETELAQSRIMAAVPLTWRRNTVRRDDLDRFLFEPDDLVIVLGQDGLVANVAKYLDGQCVLGVNPSPARFDGILVQLNVDVAVALIEGQRWRDAFVEHRTMVEVELDDGQKLRALNEIFVGHRSHQSARYQLQIGSVSANHSSSGVLVTTGTGASGWARSINRQRRDRLQLPRPTDSRLSYFVREAFPSVATSTQLTQGDLGEGQAIDVVSRMNEGGTIFGDGMEADSIVFDWGMKATVRVAERRLHLVTGGRAKQADLRGRARD
jgi:NAD kinase